MEPVRTISGTMVPLPRANVDTDQIIPKQFLKRVERSGFGPYLFYDWCRDAEGELDPQFVLNRPEYTNAAILVSGPNFGSGSSREHAPWALEDWGFRAVIAPSFADIFRNNCHNIGLLPVELPEEDIATLTALAENEPDAQIEIDLEAQVVRGPGLVIAFDIDPFAKHNLLHGLDQVGLTLEAEGAIDAFEASRKGFLPRLT